jgi:hypothetical protein
VINVTAGRRDRKRRQQLMEQSFADAANNHGFKRSRWRRQWRQEIQDWMIAAAQNIRILAKSAGRKLARAAAVIAAAQGLNVVFQLMNHRKKIGFNYTR